MNSNDQMNAGYYNNGQPQNYVAPDVGYTSKQ